MLLFRSLAFKNAIIYLVIFLTGLGLTGFLLLHYSSKRIIAEAENQLLHSADLVEIQIKEYINELIKDLDFLSDSPVLTNYLKNASPQNTNQLNQEFLSLISSNKNYAQLRYLDANSGKEKARVNYINDIPVITQEEQLQNKSKRPYYTQTILLDSTEIYTSPINLNREFGEISLPHTPTLRIAKPVYYRGLLSGIIVINTNLTELFNALKKSVGEDFNLRMYNQEGFYLLHENTDSTFIFEYGDTHSQVSVFHTSPAKKITRTDEELTSNHSFSIPQMTYTLYFNVIANKSKLLHFYYEWRNKSIYLIIIIGLLFSSVAFLILRRQSKTLKRLISNINTYPIKREVSELPINRKDELGELARSFGEMVEIINNQIDNIESEKQKAEKAEQEKSKFIENISHEIRNPLQSIIGLSSILEQNNPKSHQIDILKSIKLNTTNLKALVNSILDYQNLRSGALKVQRNYTSVVNLVTELITGIQLSAHEKNIQIVVNVADRLDAVDVYIDRLRVSQILNNLISNAITNTPMNGEIQVVADIVHSQMDRATIRFSVVDNGIGISDSEILKIKERYYSTRSVDALNTNYGLGLTIVNELLMLLGSELNINSVKNKGSIFSFDITEKIRPAEKSGNISVSIPSDLSEKRILVVDDDEQIIELYRHHFEGLDATFLSNLSIENESFTQAFDIIITDFRLGQKTVVDHLIELQNLSYSHSALIIVSGTQADLTPIEELFPGVVSLLKPMSKESLLHAIHKGSIFASFGKPNLHSVKKDYDFDKEKYSKAFSILLDEWKTYTSRLHESIMDKDQNDFEATIHKLNNTLRRLDLHKYESHLIAIQELLHSKDFQHNKIANETRETMEMYYTAIKSAIE